MLNWDKVYLVTYNKLINMSTNHLLSLAQAEQNHFVKNIAIRVLIDDDRLLKVNDKETLIFIVDLLCEEDLWYLATISDNCLVKVIARQKIIEVIDKTFVYSTSYRLKK